MTSDGLAKRALRRLVPSHVRAAIYGVRRLGTRGYAASRLAAYARRGAPAPKANEPFDIGARVPIMLHASTVRGFESHLRDDPGGRSELDVFKELAKGRGTFLDVGAGAGIFSASFCAVTGRRAYAFEPSPAMFESLTALLELNPGFDIVAHNTALGGEAGSRAVEPHGAQYRGVTLAESDTATTMTVATLDDFAASLELSPDFAKVDVEGMELDVLRGGAQTFTDHVDALMLELHPRILGSTDAVVELQQLLHDYGFDLMTLDLTPIADLSGHVTGARGKMLRAVNIVAIKPRAGAAK